VLMNNAADCAPIPYHLKCIMRESEVPLISLCLLGLVNFVKNACTHCNFKGISPYLELSPCKVAQSVTIQKLPVISGDPGGSGKNMVTV